MTEIADRCRICGVTEAETIGHPEWESWSWGRLTLGRMPHEGAEANQPAIARFMTDPPGPTCGRCHLGSAVVHRLAEDPDSLDRLLEPHPEDPEDEEGRRQITVAVDYYLAVVRRRHQQEGTPS